MVSGKSKKVDLSGRMFTCPVQGKRTTFQLVDEFGGGKLYAGLAYEVVDFEGFKYSGYLDSSGAGEVVNHFAGPIALSINSPCEATKGYYHDLIVRESYP